MYIKAFPSVHVVEVLHESEEVIDACHYKDSTELDLFVADWLGEEVFAMNDWQANGMHVIIFREKIKAEAVYYAPGGVVINNNNFIADNHIPW